jgi:hypothetical protein
MVGFLRLGGYASLRFRGNTLTTYHERWLNFFNAWPVASFD